ncbi:hypothetical protein [Fodinicola feengrottensis]|uniref:Uncharacterized protein n=1 Tax=Fodinicola feengrottensis TaxID=435914 RepID=A0ABN2ILU3_9ACTN|nr:hypothetical protein [Fodinicola feengrottensis]
MSVEFTKRDEAAEDAAALSAVDSAPNAEPRRAGTRARIPPVWITERIARWRALIADRERMAATVQVSLWREAPASIADLAGYAKAAPWAGDDSPVLAALGRLYAIGIGIPASVLLYALAWVLQRPMRLLFGLFVIAVVWLAS